jgi:hypothetical protein
VSDARATYENSYIQDGFVAQLRGFDTDMLETLELLKKKRFLDSRSTRAVFVDFTAYLPNRKVLTHDKLQHLGSWIHCQRQGNST